MFMEQVSNQKAEILIDNLKSVWDIGDHYWYPLSDCKRNDVIAFNSNYIDEVESKISDIKNFILTQKINQIFEMREDRTVWIYEIDNLDPSYYDGIERFCFDENMNWIIYASHEGSITLGGRELISSLKEKWQDWESNLYPV
jgi:hypothetical protein